MDLRVLVCVAAGEAESLQAEKPPPGGNGARDHGKDLAPDQRRAGALITLDALNGNEFAGEPLAHPCGLGGIFEFLDEVIVEFTGVRDPVVVEDEDRPRAIGGGEGRDQALAGGGGGDVLPSIRRRDREIVFRIDFFRSGESRRGEGQEKYRGQQEGFREAAGRHSTVQFHAGSAAVAAMLG